jgi:hypothetical protein
MSQSKKDYDLFLDDERFPPRQSSNGTQRNWIICRTFEEAVTCVEKNGIPRHINFDHDLGLDENLNYRKTGADFTKWLVNWCMDNKWPWFNFSVHSMNPVGARNIEMYLAQYLTMDPPEV